MNCLFMYCFAPTCRFLPLLCSTELPYFCIQASLLKLQYVAKISVNKSLEQGEQEISTLQTSKESLQVDRQVLLQRHNFL